MDEDVRTSGEGSADPASSRRPRGWVSLYAVAFALLVGAGVAITLAAVSLLESTGLLWVSTTLSAAAIVLAIVAVLLPRR